MIIGSARDIVEEVAVARFLFTDLPLGNPCGPPNDRHAQLDNVTMAIQMLESTVASRTTVQAPVRWVDDQWRETFMKPHDSANI